MTASTPSKSNTYPLLDASYQGKIDDLKDNQSSPMTLSGISQNNGQISGTISALQMSETFNGSLDTSKHISFFAAASGDHGELSFTGAVQPDGELDWSILRD